MCALPPPFGARRPGEAAPWRRSALPPLGQWQRGRRARPPMSAEGAGRGAGAAAGRAAAAAAGGERRRRGGDGAGRAGRCAAGSRPRPSPWRQPRPGCGVGGWRRRARAGLGELGSLRHDSAALGSARLPSAGLGSARLGSVRSGGCRRAVGAPLSEGPRGGAAAARRRPVLLSLRGVAGRLPGLNSAASVPCRASSFQPAPVARSLALPLALAAPVAGGDPVTAPSGPGPGGAPGVRSV